MLRDAWTLAIETLNVIELQRLGERLALTRATKKFKIKDTKAIGLAHRLVSETIRKKNYIDFLLNSVLEPQSLSNLKLGSRSFLRLYCYETKLANRNIETASKIAQMGRTILGWKHIKDMEMALGEILSSNPTTVLTGLEETEKIGLQTFHPTWFVKYCFRLLGREEALRFLEKSAEITPTYIRLNTLIDTEEILLKKMEAEKIILEKVPHLEHVYKLIKTKKPLTRTKSYCQGNFYIQDKASCLATQIADPKQDTVVLDICAAPGSKTTYLAQLMKNRGQLISLDYSKRRINVWKRQTKRMVAKIVSPIVVDARNTLPLNFYADLVILDPPCTSTGTFGKMPEAKWRLNKRSIVGMSKIQTEMIEQAARYVKENGFLVYSTCSISVEENEMVIENFLKFHSEFKLTESNPKLGLPGLRGLTKCQRLYPHVHDCNGFFVAKLNKN